MSSSSLGDSVRAVLSDTMNLPAEFLGYLTQHVAQNPVPVPDRSAGYEIGFDQIGSPVNITGLTQGSPTTAIAGTEHAFDGNPVMCEVFSPAIILPSVAGGSFNIALYEGGSILGVLGTFVNPAAAGSDIPACVRYRFTPAKGTHTYSVMCYVSSTTGTPQFFAGNALTGDVPAYLRFTKV